MPCKNVSSRSISTFCNNKRLPGRQNYRIMNSLITDIRKIIPSVKNEGSFNSWACIANDELVWSIWINNVGQNDHQSSNYNPEWDGNIPYSKSLPLKLFQVFLYLLPKTIPPQNSPSNNANITDSKFFLIF